MSAPSVVTSAPLLSDAERRERLARLPTLVHAPVGHVDVCVFDAHDDEALLIEVGRQRERCFRGIGGGTGHDFDLDDDDFGEGCYQQLVIVDRETQDLIGGCRFAVASRRHGRPLATEHMFAFDDAFRADILPGVLDIGRMFIVPQHRARRQNALSLDHMFRGLAFVALDDEVQQFFGRVVFDKHTDPFVRDLTLAYLRHHFSGTGVQARHPEPMRLTSEPLGVDFTDDAKRDLRTILQAARRRGGTIPALVRAYVGMSPRLQVFDSAKDHDIGGIEEVCMLVHKHDISFRRGERWLRTRDGAVERPSPSTSDKTPATSGEHHVAA